MKQLFLFLTLFFYTSVFSQFTFTDSYYRVLEMDILVGAELPANSEFKVDSVIHLEPNSIFYVSEGELTRIDNNEIFVKIVFSGNLQIGEMQDIDEVFYIFGADPNQIICRVVFMYDAKINLYVIRIDYKDARFIYYCEKI